MLQGLEHLMARIVGLVREERGAAMVEYGILVAFIAVVVMAAVIVLGGEIAGLFNGISL